MPLSSLILLILHSAQWPTVSPAELKAVDLNAGWVKVAKTEGTTLPNDTELVLAAEVVPIGRFRLTEQGADHATFARAEPTLHAGAGRLRAWFVSPRPSPQLWEKWPAEADFMARIERVGPGMRGVWIDAGATSGIQPGMSWWQRIDGQPVARFDVLSVEADACYCSVARLAADAPIRRHDRVALWPSPGRRRNGTAASAVSYIERSEERTIVWVAGLRGVEVPPEPHVDFFHNAHYVAHGVVESADNLFWYARLIEGGANGGGDRAEQPPSIAVGDSAIIRTRADIAARRFPARVFEISADGALINAGESDELSLGQTGGLYRGGEKIGEVRITRLQRSYAVIQPAETPPEPTATRPASQQPSSGATSAIQPAVLPAIGDVVRFSDPPAPAVHLAEIENVVDGNLFSARALAHVQVTALTPLLVRNFDGGGGVALVLASDGQRICGLVLECSLAAPLRPGAIIVGSNPAQPAEQR